MIRAGIECFVPTGRARLHALFGDVISLAVSLAFSLALILGDPQIARSAEPPVAIEIAAQPIAAFDLRHSAQTQFGLLEFRGGLVLRSSYKHFGGLSAI